MLRQLLTALPFLSGAAACVAADLPTTSPLAVVESFPTTTTALGQEVVEDIFGTGPEEIARLFAALEPTGSALSGDLKVRYALHAMAVRVSRPGAEDEQRIFNRELFSALAKHDDPQVKRFLLEQLEFSGTRADAAQLVPLLKDPDLLHGAARAIRMLDEATADRATSAAQELPSEPTVYAGAKDLPALLLHARRLAESGQTTQAAELVRPLAQLPVESGREYVQCAALGCLAQFLGPDAQADLENAMSSPAREVRAAALAHVRRLPGELMTRRWISIADKAAPDLKGEILQMLAERGDRSAAPILITSLLDLETTVRLAAIPALVKLTGAEGVPPLLGLARTASEAELKRIQTVLSTVRGDDVNSRIAAASRELPGPARLAMFETLAARGASDQTGTLIAAAEESNDIMIRVAALKAAETLARSDDLPRLIEILFRAQTDAERSAAQKAVVTVGRAMPEGEAVKLLQEKWSAADTAKRNVILESVARLGGGEALALLAESAADGEGPLRETAVRRLAEWPDRAALPELLKIGRISGDLTHRALVVRGCLRLAGGSGVSGDEQLDILRKIMDIAPRGEERKLVLAAAGGVATVSSLSFIRGHLDNKALGAEAAQAIFRLTVPQDEKGTALSGGEAAAALRQALDVLDEAAAGRARARLEELE